MAQVVVTSNVDGGVGVAYPTGEVPVEKIAAMINGYVVDNSTLPQNHDFFNAWEQTRGVVTVNLAKAKEITKTRLRQERIPLLAAQDVAFQRAQETGADTSAIVAEKQRLRDITNLADACTTLEQLRALSC